MNRGQQRKTLCQQLIPTPRRGYGTCKSTQRSLGSGETSRSRVHYASTALLPTTIGCSCRRGMHTRIISVCRKRIAQVPRHQRHQLRQCPADGLRRPPHGFGRTAVCNAGMASRAAWSLPQRRSRAAWMTSAGTVARRSSWSWRVSLTISMLAWAARASSSRCRALSSSRQSAQRAHSLRQAGSSAAMQQHGQSLQPGPPTRVRHERSTLSPPSSESPPLS